MYTIPGSYSDRRWKEMTFQKSPFYVGTQTGEDVVMEEDQWRT